jgi:hypothetical protein
MYLQKQSQPSRSNRRLYPRLRARLTTEIEIEGVERPVLGILTNLSVGGCYIESGAMLLPGSKLKLTFSVEQIGVVIQSEVVRMDMGIGAAIKFTESTHEVRVTLHRALEQLASLEGKTDRKRGQNATAGA